MKHHRASVIALGCIMLAAGALGGCADSHTATGKRRAASDPNGSPAVPIAVPAPAAKGGRAVQVADPEEYKSFPAAASVHHKAAATPSKAGAATVAAGAPSDAEVRSELAQMHAVERTAQQAQQLQLTPVAGGQSIGGNG